MRVRAGTIADEDAWLRMRRSLWPDADEASLRAEMNTIVGDDSQAVFIAEDDDGQTLGFAEVSIHPHAVGCQTHPVGYLEGWYVEAAHRRRGVGRALIATAEVWVREKGCVEFASDTWLGNAASIAAHRQLGFEETERLVHFRKPL
jgi:aminoglycoside 6'-N-acetyltransferase I